MVPFGPRLLLNTSCNPSAALMVSCNACPLLATSALGLANCIAADALQL